MIDAVPDVSPLALPSETGPAELEAMLRAAQLAARAGGGVVVDCSAAPFLATSAVQVLLALQRACRAREQAFALVGVSEPAAAYLRLAGLAGLLDA
ncbi:STAS domain-containing protein [Gemmata sp. JC717]|uniref:STAS domain-containing protein n=1 Tax=Gemmata algarum TaxID=2975278 RepID=UPI0021BB50DA|nr:STAS domain-containing protein [Gemmata algarum]MDY3552958.1 STAS domain-containing protein [Gemmata algarum]